MNRTLVLLSVVLLSAIIVISYIFYIQLPKVGYVNYSKVLNEFKMSKDINSNKEVYEYQKRVDSLYSSLEAANETNAKTKIMQQLIAEKNNLEILSNNLMSEELKKINSRIRSYGTDFSSSKGYSVLLGLGPDMSVISGDSKNDVTEEFISYINKRYEGDR